MEKMNASFKNENKKEFISNKLSLIFYTIYKFLNFIADPIVKLLYNYEEIQNLLLFNGQNVINYFFFQE